MIPAAPPPLSPGFHAVPAGHLAAIVTALDMHAPRGTPPRPLPEGYVLNQQKSPSNEWYLALFRAIGAPWLWTSRLRLSPPALTAILTSPDVDIYALHEGSADGDPVGLLELDFSTAGQCEVAFFGLVDRCRRRGLGRPMMDFALHHAWSRPGVECVWIHTCSLDDPAALRFYQSCGFKPYARQVEILADPRLAGILPADCAPLHPLL